MNDKEDTIKDIVVNLIQETREPENDGAAGAVLEAVLQMMILSEDGGFENFEKFDAFGREQRRKDAEQRAVLDRRYKEQKELEQQIGQILLDYTIDK